MKKDNAVYLNHILDAIIRIEEYIKGISRESFLKNYLLQDGIVRQLEIIGEASSKISSYFQKDHPNLPWKSMIGIRNRLIHAYFEVDLTTVWDTVQVDIPDLKIKVQIVLKNLN